MEIPMSSAQALRARSAALFLVVATLVTAGCQTAYYAAWEQLGIEKRDILRSRVEDAREEQQEAQEQFQTTYERFVEITGYDGGDLESVYSKLNGDFERSEAKAQAVRDRIASIEDVAADLFSEWESEINLISSAEMRRKSTASLRDTQQRYSGLVGAMKRAEAKMDPVLTAFRDQVLFLKHNLNAQAISSLQTDVASIENDVAVLIREMQSSIQEADTFLATMGG